MDQPGVEVDRTDRTREGSAELGMASPVRDRWPRCRCLARETVQGRSHAGRRQSRRREHLTKCRSAPQRQWGMDRVPPSCVPRRRIPRAGGASRGTAPSPVKLRVIHGEASRLTTTRGAGKRTGPARYCRARSRIATVRVAVHQLRIEPETDWKEPASHRASERHCDHG